MTARMGFRASSRPHLGGTVVKPLGLWPVG